MVKKSAAKKTAKSTTSAKKTTPAAKAKTSRKVVSVSAKTVRASDDTQSEGTAVENVAEKNVAADNAQKKKAPAKKKSAKKPVVKTITSTKKGLKLAPGVLISGVKKSAPQPCSCNKSAEPQTFRKLKKKEIEQIRQTLIEMRETIIEGMRKEYQDSRSRSGSAPADIVDQAADAYDDNISSEIAANNDEELEQIEAALERLKDGTYGLCEMCSDPISPTRLKILPFATRCVACRGDYEKVKKRRNGGNVNFFGDGEFDPDSE